ncbi:winged helix-turn-helix transcriptional regulator [Methanobrevibacter oralis]|uniref:HTH-type transcriptional regulator YybR n=1 Tax=Methanobrevibacter oralis TaxID=66851 RepID=A0A166BRC4_METOA|nr:helix-turn-helix domain-containing protein [Methanobrevibacter oralis]KZX13718.1 putative HTH-type transcriptional regulator YybR [Methanobrevibacter oralis]
MVETYQYSHEDCYIKKTLKILNKKWAIVILKDLFTGKRYFSQFLEDKPDLRNNVLSYTLKCLEKNQLIEKKTTSLNKTSTEYHLTVKGRKLNKTLYEMAMFGLYELSDEDLIKKEEIKSKITNILCNN